MTPQQCSRAFWLPLNYDLIHGTARCPLCNSWSCCPLIVSPPLFILLRNSQAMIPLRRAVKSPVMDSRKHPISFGNGDCAPKNTGSLTRPSLSTVGLAPVRSQRDKKWVSALRISVDIFFRDYIFKTQILERISRSCFQRWKLNPRSGYLNVYSIVIVKDYFFNQDYIYFFAD